MVAERLWSLEGVNDVEAMYKRLDVISGDLEWLGLQHRSRYPLMLRRLTGMGPIDRLKVPADVLEPLKNYGRIPLHYSVDTPLNRLVDSVQPESNTARTFAGWVADARWIKLLKWPRKATELSLGVQDAC